MKRHTASCDDCGWTGGPYRSPAQAQYALARHSCERQRARDAAAARGAARRAQVDRTPKPCLHKRTTHQHGTHACYVLDRCRCTPCATANTAYERQRSRRHAYGRFGNDWVDAQPVRDHVATLAAAGIGLKQITRHTGINGGVLSKLVYGAPRPDGTRRPPSRRVKVTTAAKIFALDPRDLTLLADGAFIDGTGTARRIQALVARGWSISKLAARLGMERSNFTPIATGARSVTVATAKAVADLYEQLWNTEPPRDNHRDRIAYSRAIHLAAQRGYAPPLAWDDDTIDDPNATPHVEREHRPGGKRIHIEDLEFLVDNGLTRDQVAHRLRVAKSAIAHACARDNRRDLLERMTRNAIAQDNAA